MKEVKPLSKATGRHLLPTHHGPHQLSAWLTTCILLILPFLVFHPFEHVLILKAHINGLLLCKASYLFRQEQRNEY